MRRPAPASREGQRAIYLYGVSRGKAAMPERLSGVDGLAPVEALPCAGLVCWISRVPRGEYAERLPQNMENLDWLAAASVRHQRVVGTLARERDVLPARFGTVFLSEASLEADIRARRAAIDAALRRIAGAEEWGVKIFAESPAPPSVETFNAGSGREYLKQKAVMLQQRARVGPPPELGPMLESLQRVVLGSVVSKTAPGQPGLVWQASFLVRRTAKSRFHAVLEQYARKMPQARIETTGPWPAYSFVREPQASDGAARPAERGRHKPGPRSTARRASHGD